VNLLISLVAVVVLFVLGLLGARAGLESLIGIVLPYLAVVLFVGGLLFKVIGWAKIPVPFRIPTTCGQEKSLPWIKRSKLENPANTREAVGRMLLEVLFFRSLLRNTKAELTEDGRAVYVSSIWLWLGSMVFHWSMLIILVRHLRLFVDPVPGFVTAMERADGFLQVGVPVFYITSFAFLAGLAYLLIRRIGVPTLRYISLATDYFPLFLLIGIGLSGFWMRYLSKTDVVGVKELLTGLVGFQPTIPASIDPIFYGHFFLVSVLLAYFPFSKLAHMAGVFLSPTRNLANNNRMVRHINPWDYPVKVHTYEEYEDEFREKMKGAGVPVEKE